jgi:hypothetical protein
MNRCSGLLFARAELEKESLSPSAADFVRRNVAKAQLACGDALLAAQGRYHWSCRERHRRLEHFVRERRSAWFNEALRLHALGVEFKLRPESGPRSRAACSPRGTPRSPHSRRNAGSGWRRGAWAAHSRHGAAYVEAACDGCPGSSPFLNVLLNLRADGFRPRARPSPWRHPRQRMFHSLALLLWEPGAATAIPPSGRA